MPKKPPGLLWTLARVGPPDRGVRVFDEPYLIFQNLRPRWSINILAARLLERYTMREDKDVGTMNLIYILVVIILILVALLLLAPLL